MSGVLVVGVGRLHARASNCLPRGHSVVPKRLIRLSGMIRFLCCIPTKRNLTVLLNIHPSYALFRNRMDHTAALVCPTCLIGCYGPWDGACALGCGMLYGQWDLVSFLFS